MFGKLTEADDETINAWSRYQVFACGLCAHVFQVGDLWCMVMANTQDSPTRRGNFLTCGACHEKQGGDRLKLCGERRKLEEQVEKLERLGLVDTNEQINRAFSQESRASYDAGFNDGFGEARRESRDW